MPPCTSPALPPPVPSSHPSLPHPTGNAYLTPTRILPVPHTPLSVQVVTHTGKNETYLLYQCGTDVPKPADYGLPEGTKTFAIPLTAISVVETGPVAFMVRGVHRSYGGWTGPLAQ